MMKSPVLRALRKVILALGLICFGLVLAVVVLEVALSIFPVPNRFELNQQLAAQWQSDDEFLLHLKPNLNLRITAHPEFQYTVQTNADGLRDESFDKPFDVAAIGDSFTFGFGVEEPEAWPSRLETISGARVANLGWEGWSSYVYPTTIRRHAIPLHTHLWIWAFFINDLTESAGAEAFVQSGQTDFKAQAYSQPPFPFNLRSFGAIMAFINPEYRLLPDSGDTVFDDGTYQMLLSHYAWNHTNPDDPEVQRGWELTEAALADAEQLATENAATLLLVYIPPREQVYWPIIKDSMPDVDVRQLDDVAARLAAFSDAHGIQFLSLLPGLRDEAMQGHMLYFPGDGHWNVAGHDLAAHLIADRIAQDHLLAQ